MRETFGLIWRKKIVSVLNLKCLQSETKKKMITVAIQLCNHSQADSCNHINGTVFFLFAEKYKRNLIDLPCQTILAIVTIAFGICNNTREHRKYCRLLLCHWRFFCVLSHFFRVCLYIVLLIQFVTSNFNFPSFLMANEHL